MNRKLQREIIDRDKKCILCESEKYLHVHHINEIVNGEYLSAYVTEIPDLLVTLCRSCHGHMHGKGGGRGKWDYRRRLIQKVFNVDIGCGVHRYMLIDGEVKCKYCGKGAQKH